MFKNKSKSIRSYLFNIILPVVFLFSCNSKGTNEIPIIEAVTAIRLSESQTQLANIKSSMVTEGVIEHQLMFTGVLKVDEQSSVTISSRAGGRIEKLFFKNTGEKINAGDELFEFYSEELWNAERGIYKSLTISTEFFQ